MEGEERREREVGCDGGMVRGSVVTGGSGGVVGCVIKEDHVLK